MEKKTNENSHESSVKHIHELISAAALAQDSGDAMRYAQAALNATNALIGLHNCKTSHNIPLPEKP